MPRAIRAAVALAPLLGSAAGLASEVPPLLPVAVADAEATVAVVAQSDGRVAAVELTGGQVRWRSPQGRWPLASGHGWVAVGAPDSADPRALRVRFLRPTDGKLIVASAPIALPAVIGANASWEGEGLTLGTGDTSVQLSAWIPRPKTSGDSRVERLHIRWRTQSFVGGGGMRPPERGPIASGLAFVDPTSGAVSAGPDDPAQGPEPHPPKLPPSWKRSPGTIYWSWSWFGAAWSDRPRAFWIGPGVAGFFSYETATRRLLLNRFGPIEPLSSFEIAAGGEWAPQVSLDGRHLLLSKGNAGVETFTLFDLVRPGSAAALPIPHLEPRFRSPFAVVGPSLYYVAEGDGVGGTSGATSFPRWLVCVDWAGGKIRWRHALPPRVLPPPMAGAGPGSVGADKVPGRPSTILVGGPPAAGPPTCTRCGPAPMYPTRFCTDGRHQGGRGPCIQRRDGTCSWLRLVCPEEVRPDGAADCSEAECGSPPAASRWSCPGGATGGIDGCERTRAGGCGWILRPCLGEAQQGGRPHTTAPPAPAPAPAPSPPRRCAPLPRDAELRTWPIGEVCQPGGGPAPPPLELVRTLGDGTFVFSLHERCFRARYKRCFSK